MSFKKYLGIVTKFLPDTQVIVVGSFIAAIVAFLYIWQWVGYLEEGFQVQRLLSEQKSLEEQKELLMLERAFLSRFERLESVARKQFDLKYSEPSQYRKIFP